MRKFQAIAAVAAAFLFASCGTTTTTVKGGIAGTDSLLNQQPEASATPANAENKGAGDKSAEERQEKNESVLNGAGTKLDKDVVAIIGKYVLTKEKYRIITEYMKQRYDYKLTPEQEREFIEFIINKKLMAQEGRALGYADKEDIKVKYEWDFDDLVSHAFYEDMIERKSNVGASQAQDYYNANKGDFSEVKAQHILVKNRDMAKNLYNRIVAGESFDDIAKKYSEDETTKMSGGNLGFFAKGAMVKEFEDAAFVMGKDEVSEPVKTVYGWHIIKVQDKRQISFDESKDRIMKMIKEQRAKDVFDRVMNDLKKKYKVQVNEDVIK
jgi:parvulin-like peptidyl-prolyl isomerase